MTTLNNHIVKYWLKIFRNKDLCKLSNALHVLKFSYFCISLAYVFSNTRLWSMLHGNFVFSSVLFLTRWAAYVGMFHWEVQIYTGEKHLTSGNVSKLFKNSFIIFVMHILRLDFVSHFNLFNMVLCFTYRNKPNII